MSTLPPASPELKRLIGRKFLLALISLIGLGLGAAFLMVHFRTELELTTQAIFDTVGLSGLAAVLFLSDALVSPIPPDSILILISASPYHADWPLLIPALGLLSSAAGCLGYAGGRYFSEHPRAIAWFGQFRARGEANIQKFGPWGVALGALTPLPFSITCWGAGLLHLPFKNVWPSSLLRVPRYVVYYAAIAYFPRLFS